MLDLHDHWKSKKELAEKLYKAGIKKRHEELSKELKEKIERLKEKFILYSGKDAKEAQEMATTDLKGKTGDEWVAEMKNKLKEEGIELQKTIKVEAKFPVDFEDGLGKLLDKITAYFKDGSEKHREERDKVTDKTLVTIANYRVSITEKKDQLAKANPAIADLLKEALAHLDSLVRNWNKHDAKSVDQRTWDDCQACLTKWEQAKKDSQKKFKDLPKEAMLFLKAEKCDKYPINFKRGLSDTIKAFKNITSGAKELPKMAAEVGNVVTAYRSDIELAKKKYKKIVSLGAEWNEVFDPLEESLTQIEEWIVNRVK